MSARSNAESLVTLPGSAAIQHRYLQTKFLIVLIGFSELPALSWRSEVFRSAATLGSFFFRRRFRDHHGPVGLVAGLIVTGDGDPDDVGFGLQQVRIVARRCLPHAERLRPGTGAGRYVLRRHTRTRAGHPGGERPGHM